MATNRRQRRRAEAETAAPEEGDDDSEDAAEDVYLVYAPRKEGGRRTSYRLLCQVVYK